MLGHRREYPCRDDWAEHEQDCRAKPGYARQGEGDEDVGRCHRPPKEKISLPNPPATADPSQGLTYRESSDAQSPFPLLANPLPAGCTWAPITSRTRPASQAEKVRSAETQRPDLTSGAKQATFDSEGGTSGHEVPASCERLAIISVGPDTQTRPGPHSLVPGLLQLSAFRKGRFSRANARSETTLFLWWS